MTEQKKPLGTTVQRYTRKNALDDGYLVDVSEAALEAGFFLAVAITREAYERDVRWLPEDSERQVEEDESLRLWAVLYMARNAARAYSGNHVTIFEFVAIPRDGRTKRPVRRTLKMVLGTGDQGEPVITIMLPTER